MILARLDTIISPENNVQGCPKFFFHDRVHMVGRQVCVIDDKFYLFEMLTAVLSAQNSTVQEYMGTKSRAKNIFLIERCADPQTQLKGKTYVYLTTTSDKKPPKYLFSLELEKLPEEETIDPYFIERYRIASVVYPLDGTNNALQVAINRLREDREAAQAA